MRQARLESPSYYLWNSCSTDIAIGAFKQKGWGANPAKFVWNNGCWFPAGRKGRPSNLSMNKHGLKIRLFNQRYKQEKITREYKKELIFSANHSYQVGWNAFLLNEQCCYRPRSFYSREWLRGWNCAYLKNQERLCALTVWTRTAGTFWRYC